MLRIIKLSRYKSNRFNNTFKFKLTYCIIMPEVSVEIKLYNMWSDRIRDQF